ncbi:hypothetical protein ACWEWU_12135 [Staphylococcus xylosus]
MAKNKYIDNHSKDESNPLHHETSSVGNTEDVKVFVRGFNIRRKVKNCNFK